MEKFSNELLITTDSNNPNILNETDKKRIYKKLLTLIENSTKPKTQKKLKKLKSLLGENEQNTSYSIYGLDNKEIMITFAELKRLLPNMYLDKPDLYIEWLGIREFNEGSDILVDSGLPSNEQKFILNVNKFLRCLINTILHEIDFDDKVDFTFNMYDRNGDGVIDRGEMEALLEHFNDYNSLNFDTETVRSIAEVLMEKLDSNRVGVITRENFRAFLQEFQQKPLTFNPFVRERSFSIVVPGSETGVINKTKNDDHFASSSSNNEDCSQPTPPNYSLLCSINSKKIFWLIIYILCNLFFSCGSFYVWYNPNFPPLPFARSFAGLVLFNSALLLFFMCENLLTCLSNNSFFSKILPLEDTKFYHSICASVFTLSGLSHSVVHLSWTFPFLSSFSDVNELNKLIKKKLDTVPTYFYLLLQTIPGITGIVLVILTVTMSLLALPSLRKKNFELFYYFHKFYYAVFVLIGIHGMLRLVVVQTYWAFIAVPAFFYIIEIFIRIWRFFKYKTKIVSIKFLESGVVELVMQKPKEFNFLPGHYARIQIPEISAFQWHPFTIASAPEQENLIFYISPVGWWTREVEKIGRLSNPVERKYDCNIEKKKVRPKKSSDSSPKSPKEIHEIMKNPYCRIDGPFGAPAQEYKNYGYLIFIASGIGATPFSSILFDFLHKLNSLNEDKSLPYVQVDFYWVIRSYVSSSWLVDLFKELLRVAKLNKTNTILNINLIFTCSQQKYDFRSFFLWHGLELLKKERSNQVSEYCGNIFWGRPEWGVLFRNTKGKLIQMRNEANNKKCKMTLSNAGVFVCGNYELSKDVYLACKTNSDGDMNFDFHMENF